MLNCFSRRFRTHAHLTTRSDAEIVGELGWTMQIIYDLTGHIPRYYRPPYGDVGALAARVDRSDRADARVRTIAEHVFGLKTVIWNYDSEDWSIVRYRHRPGADRAGPDSRARRLRRSAHVRWRSARAADSLRGDFVTVDYCAKRMTDRMASPHPMIEGIMVLEHELSNASVSAFINSYPELALRGWASSDIASLGDLPWYQ